MKFAIGTAALLATGLAMPVIAQSDTTKSAYSDGSFCTAGYSPAADGDKEDQSKSEFAEMDLDGDGMVTQEEYVACREAAAGDTSSASGAGNSDATDSAVQAAAPDQAAGEALYQSVCKNCHGPKAQGMASFPKLAGHDAEFITSRLVQYRAGEKVGPNTALMMPLAQDLSDQDIVDLSAYISTNFE